MSISFGTNRRHVAWFIVAGLALANTPVLAQADTGGAELEVLQGQDAEDPPPAEPPPDDHAAGEGIHQPTPDAENKTETTDQSNPVELDADGKPIRKKGAYASQPEFRPDLVNWRLVREAEDGLAVTVDKVEEAEADLRRLRVQQRRLGDKRRWLSEDKREAIEQLEDAERRAKERAIAGFVASESADAATLSVFEGLRNDDALEVMTRKRLLDSALEEDDRAIDHYLALRANLGRDLLQIIERQREADEAVRQQITVIQAAEEEKADWEFQLATYRNASIFHIPELVFPIGEGYDTPLINSWGYPRAPGTPDEHWHEGIDIFAPIGTPLYATEPGIISKVGSGRLGGLTVWLIGDSGAHWYYAHLHQHAPDLRVGMKVEAGHVLGAVGDSGNAVGTPPHLHMQVHPNGGRPVNPFPSLKAASDRDIAEAANQRAVSEPAILALTDGRIR